MCSSKSQHYIRDIELSFKQLKKFTGNINLDKIDLKTIDQFINMVYARSTSGALFYFRTLKAAFSKAVVWEYIPENPFKKIKPPRQVKNYPTFINNEEFELILKNTPYNFLKEMFTVAYQTGMRLSELCNMKWSWIDIDNKIITLTNGVAFKTKSKKARKIPMSAKVYSIIKNRFDTRVDLNDDFVFYRYKGMRFKEDYITHQFKKAVRNANLKDSIHFHTLRHSFASNLVQKGVSLYVVKELLGHSDLSTTQIYSHLQSENLAQAVSLL
jgi:integrase/recombinase XerD